FEFAVSPPVVPVRAAVFDPSGQSIAFLRRAGVEIKPLNQLPETEDLPLVIGENTLSRSDFDFKALDRLIKNGAKVLVMSDRAELYQKRFGFRMAPYVSRRVFPVPGIAPSSPLAAVIAGELRDWRGSGAYVPETWGVSEERYRTNAHSYGFHWGNYGSVCSMPLEKPHASGWTPLFENEYALAYSPAMDLRLGRGLLRLSTFDFADRSEAEPAAAWLFNALLRDLAAQPVIAERRTWLLAGNPAERQLLTRMQLAFADTVDLPADPAGSLLLVGSQYDANQPELLQWVQRGGAALVLPRKTAGELPGVAVVEGVAGKNTEVPPWPVLRGVSLSDLFLKTDYRGLLLKAESPQAAVAANGLIAEYSPGGGKMVYLQLLPGMLDTVKYPYLKVPSWHVMRILSQVLTNLGAVFIPDTEFLTVKAWQRVPDTLILNTGWLAEFEYKVPHLQQPATEMPDRPNEGLQKHWQTNAFHDRNWRDIKVGGIMQANGNYFDANGILWYRTKITVPEAWRGRELVLDLGVIDDMDITYFNGHEIGRTDRQTNPKNYWSVRRIYRIASDQITYGGENVLAVRVVDNWRNGGILNVPTLRPADAGNPMIRLYSPDYDPERNGDDVYMYCNW
ncbi:MAG: hypothetical protein PHI35_09330, partial [Victivallaceae bacterium]|nr:hypothetical protein [Victivallaceae bacterium]